MNVSYLLRLPFLPVSSKGCFQLLLALLKNFWESPLLWSCDLFFTCRDGIILLTQNLTHTVVNNNTNQWNEHTSSPYYSHHDLCEACGHECKNLQGLSQHRNSCKATKEQRQASLLNHAQICQRRWEDKIKVKEQSRQRKHRLVSTLDVLNVHHCSIVETVVSVFQDETANLFHLTPCQQFWKRTPTSMPEHVITEVYNSDAFYREHVKVMQQPPEPGPHLETVIAAIMLSSDLTHLANFGDAALWSIYLFFRNLSKYFWSKPSSFTAHHIAYLPLVYLFFHVRFEYLSYVYWISCFQRIFRIFIWRHLMAWLPQWLPLHTSSASSCMRFGSFYWILNLYMHMSMELLLYVPMV